MGTFKVEIKVGDPQARTFEPLEALVDTGASYTQMPSSTLRRFGVVPHTSAEFELADGRIVENQIGRTWVEVDSRREFTLVVFVEDTAEPLLGAVTLEEFRLAVDPIGRRLIPGRGLRRQSRRSR